MTRPTSVWTGVARPASAFAICADERQGSIATQGGVGGSHRGSPESAIGEIREFQAEFETAGSTTEGTSTIRRPDAVSFDYLRALTLGPVAIGDVSQGTQSFPWRVQDAGTAVTISRLNDDGATWGDPIELFPYDPAAGGPIVELDCAFEQAGRPVIVAQRLGSLWIHWFDPAVPGFVFVALGPGRTPRCVLDDPAIDATTSDVMVFYINDTAGDVGQGAVCFRMQRERYATENLTPILGGGVLTLPGGGNTLPFRGEPGITGMAVTVPADLSTPAIQPTVPHADGTALGDFQIGDTGIFSYRVVFEFEHPITSVVLSQFYPLNGRYENMTMYAVATREDFLGGLAFVAAASIAWAPGDPVQTLTYAPGFSFLVIDTPIRGSTSEAAPSRAPAFGEGTITPAAPIATAQLPPIDRMFIEDVVRSRGYRLVVLFSVRDPGVGRYDVQNLASVLYPIHPAAEDALTPDQAALTVGELKVVLFVVGPPGSDPIQSPTVFTVVEDLLTTGQALLASGALLSNTIAAIATGVTPPDGVDPTRIFHFTGEGMNALQAALASGSLVNNTMIRTAYAPEALETTQAALPSGALDTVVLVTNATLDALEVSSNPSLTSGTLVIP